MKYSLPTERIPQESRKEINDKILFLIEHNICEENNISFQDVFESFTGKGALHNLDFKDFNNYYEYSERKKLEEVGQFFTPPKICKFIVDCVSPSNTDLIADLTFGMGQFFNFCHKETHWAVNGSKTPRMHLIIDAVAPAFRRERVTLQS